jgi:hypothetical protein
LFYMLKKFKLLSTAKMPTFGAQKLYGCNVTQGVHMFIPDRICTNSLA